MEEARVCRFPTLNEADREAITEYYRRLKESDGFDIAGLKVPKGVIPLVQCCLTSYNVVIKLYARMGLHRYNMLFRQNLELSGIKAVNKLRHCPSYFCITLDAYDPATRSKMIFQVKVFQERIHPLDVRCTIARPKVDTKKSSDPLPETGNQSTYHFYDGSLPEWPSSEDAFNDTKRFYVVKDSELQDHSWIRLYLELAFADKNRTTIYKDLSYLHIVKVVIETKEPLEPPEERLNAKCAIVYIWFINMFKPKIRMRTRPMSCKTIVTRVFNEITGHLRLRSSGWTEENAFDTNEQMLRSSGWTEENAFDTPLEKRPKTDECQQGGIQGGFQESVNEHSELEKVGTRRRSTRTHNPIQRFLG